MAFLHNHHRSWADKRFVISAVLGLVIFAISLVVTYYANSYTVAHASNSVGDIILDHIPVVNVDFIYSDGAIVFLVALLAMVVYQPKRIPFVLKTAGLFMLTRSAFLVMTHIAPPSHVSYLDKTDLINVFSSTDDLFFSAHTGVPFLAALVFWYDKPWRYIFLASTIVGALAVLFGHLHYSIDVFSAFFIAFGVFAAARALFKKDYKLLLQTESP